jgi:hypothetical protein
VAAEGNVGFLVKSGAVGSGMLCVTQNSFREQQGIFVALAK